MTWGRISWPAAVIVAALALGALMIPRGGTGTAAPVLAGTDLKAIPAPPIRLTDQSGRTVTLRQFRGNPVVLTFLDARCTSQCPVVAETIRRSLAELGPQGRRVAVVAVSTDPERDTRAAVRAFSRQHALLQRWHYLTGTRTELTPIWRAYFLFVAPANAPVKIRNTHTSATYLLDSSGRERVLMTGSPDIGSLTGRLQELLGLPVSSGEAAVPAAQPGHPAPDFWLHTFDGSRIRLRDLRGKVVLLNFWASWCRPCRSEMPELAGWSRRLQRRGLVVIGVDKQEEPATVSAFVQRYHVPYTIALDGSGEVAAQYDVSWMPTSVLIDRSGVVRFVHLGVLPGEFIGYLDKSFVR